jgi:hypothetical protein
MYVKIFFAFVLDLLGLDGLKSSNIKKKQEKRIIDRKRSKKRVCGRN